MELSMMLVAAAGIILSVYAKFAYQAKRWPFRDEGTTARSVIAPRAGANSTRHIDGA